MLYRWSAFICDRQAQIQAQAAKQMQGYFMAVAGPVKSKLDSMLSQPCFATTPYPKAATVPAVEEEVIRIMNVRHVRCWLHRLPPLLPLLVGVPAAVSWPPVIVSLHHIIGCALQTIHGCASSRQADFGFLFVVRQLCQGAVCPAFEVNPAWLLPLAVPMLAKCSHLIRGYGTGTRVTATSLAFAVAFAKAQVCACVCGQGANDV